ncbi:HSP70/90 co-chaperone [Entomophthora muscae]|uniref:HSP70/90 co-chaperone n=1 Tax=Entomophthora muscae TaxID=34485 RepID=A0ACC2SS87_9FUNG|nr:HSP70/90 co-chaperone [Entomophthora muscae]
MNALLLGKMRYNDAVQYYTQALDQNSQDISLNIACYINRAAVNLELGNYGKVLGDCSKALHLDPKNVKAFYRSSKALYQLGRAQDVIACCECGLRVEPENSSLKTLLIQAKTLKEKVDEKERIKAEREQKEAERVKELEAALQDGKIRMIDSNDKMYKPDLKSNSSVKFDKSSGQLIWPVFFLYPEFKESDFIEKCEDGTSFMDHLEVMFEMPAPWDNPESPKYTKDSIEVYFESFPTNVTKPSLVKVGKKCTIRQVLSHPKYFVVSGVPSFIILSNDSKVFKEEFIARYRK